MALLILFAAALAGGYIFPWWWPAIAAYGIGFWLPRNAASAFASGFAGAGLAWAGLAAFLDWRNHHLLSGRIAALFHLQTGWAVVALTGILGGLMGGLGAWAGYALRAYAMPRPAGVATVPVGGTAGSLSADGETGIPDSPESADTDADPDPGRTAAT
ncbi:MAG: hypothetical protein JWP91_257 [Fibrobacteres bacterium]|nr:hypothetical protein [Fibrobacterota bacterium]